MSREIDAIRASTESIFNWINRSCLLSNRSNSGQDVLHLHTSIRCRSKRNSGSIVESIVGFQISSHRWVTGYTVFSGSRSTAKQSRNVGKHQDTATGSINCLTTTSKTAQSHSPSLVGHHDQASNRLHQISSSSTLSSAQCASSTSGISKNPSESEPRTLKVERMHLPFFFLPLRQTVLVLWCFLAFFL
jgi:hypothetical protein